MLVFVLGTEVMEEESDGTMIIEIPRVILDSKNMMMDNEFDARMNDNSKRYVELQGSNPNTRILQTEYKEGDRLLEIVGTQYPISVA